MPPSDDRPAAYRFRVAVMGESPPTPDHPPPGWVTGPPDFVGVGFQRCGTTRWWQLVTEHPGIHRPERKELHFFDSFQGYGPSPEIETAYRRHFPRPDGLLCGEWTPRYALDHWTPALLGASAPEALVLVSLRDPVERFVSGLAWAERRRVLSDDNVAAHLLRSAYLPQLRHLLRYIARDKLVVLQFEKSLADPARELRRVYTALGIDSTFEPAGIAAAINRSELPGAITAAERLQLVRWFKDGVVELASDFPEIDLRLWPNFAHLAA